MSKSAGYVSADYLRKAAAMTQTLKQRTYTLMNIQPGHQLLDVGCGPGIDTIELARCVDATGHVYGVDIDKDMLAEADALAEKENLRDRLTHQQADVLTLPFETDQLDACRAERLFQVLPVAVDKTQVLNELLRVIKPGGRIVLADTDWATASVDYDDPALERKLMGFFAQQLRPNAYAGRQFFRMLKQQGLRNIEIELFPMLVMDYTQTPFGDWLCGEALAQAIVETDAIQQWQRSLTELSENGEFYCTVNMVVVSADNV